MLTATGTDAWVFAASGVEPIVEESIFFAGLGGPRKTAARSCSPSGHRKSRKYAGS